VATPKKVYWVGWARPVGERRWRQAVVVPVDDPFYGWRWIEDNWLIRHRHSHSLCVLRVDETPYKTL
jgi:hypothetical protein